MESIKISEYDNEDLKTELEEKITSNTKGIFKLNKFTSNTKNNKEFISKYFKTIIYSPENLPVSKFLNSKYIANIDGQELIFKKSKHYVTFPANIREDISESFRIYLITKEKKSETGNEKVFIKKFELSGVEMLFYKEGLNENGIKKEEIDNDIGKDKDQKISLNNNLNKKPGM